MCVVFGHTLRLTEDMCVHCVCGCPHLHAVWLHQHPGAASAVIVGISCSCNSPHSWHQLHASQHNSTQPYLNMLSFMTFYDKAGWSSQSSVAVHNSGKGKFCFAALLHHT